MSRVVVMDTGPLGLLSHPRNRGQIEAWANGLTESGVVLAVPEIADYEVRRELLRAGKMGGLARLDELKATLYYLPITTATMLQAAEYWAQARSRGKPPAPPGELDADVILAAQATAVAAAGNEVVVATTNPGHISQFVDARLWHEIQ